MNALYYYTGALGPRAQSRFPFRKHPKRKLRGDLRYVLDPSLPEQTFLGPTADCKFPQTP